MKLIVRLHIVKNSILPSTLTHVPLQTSNPSISHLQLHLFVSNTFPGPHSVKNEYGNANRY